MGNDIRTGLFVLPWLRLPREARVGRVRFIPFDRTASTAPLELALANRPAGQLDMFATIERRIETADTDPETAPQIPVQELTAITLEGREGYDEWSLAECDEMWRATQVFCFACLAENEYLDCHKGAPVSSACFRPWFLGRDDIQVFPIRKRGQGEIAAWPPEWVRITQPLQCARYCEVAWNDDFATSLLQVLGSPPDGLEGLWEAMLAFNAANTEDQDQWPEQELLLFMLALCHLTGKGDASQVASVVAGLLEEYAKPNLVSSFAGQFGATRSFPGTWVEAAEQGKGYGRPLANDASRILQWVSEMWAMRDKIAHARSLEEERWAWSLPEHLLMATFALPLAVKCLLVGEKYKLTPEDRFRLAMIEILLGIAPWVASRDSDSGEAYWVRAFREFRLWLCGRPEHRELVGDKWRQREL